MDVVAPVNGIFRLCRCGAYYAALGISNRLQAYIRIVRCRQGNVLVLFGRGDLRTSFDGDGVAVINSMITERQ